MVGFQNALREGLAILGSVPSNILDDAAPILLQEVFDRFVAGLHTSLRGSVDYLGFDVQFEGLQVTIVNTATARTFEAPIRQDGSFVFPKLDPAEYRFVVSGGAVVAHPDLRVVIVDGEHAEISVPLAHGSAISGSVVEQGTLAALPGASVRLQSTSQPVSYGALADEQGYFSITDIQPGEYVLNASAAGYEAQSQVITIGTTASALLSLELEPGASIQGFVTEVNSGAPILEATVTFIRESDGSSLAALTNSAGKYTLDGLGEGDWSVTVDHPQFKETAPATITISDDGAHVFNAQLDAGAAVSGTVRDAAGTPIEGVTVRAVVSDVVVALTSTADDGTYQLEGIPEEVGVALRFQAPSYVKAEIELASLTDDEQRTGINVGLQNAATLSVQVLDPDGVPVAGASVKLTDVDGNGEFILPTDASGILSLSHLPKTAYEVSATAPNLHALPQTVDLIAQDSVDMTVQLFENAALTVTVRDLSNNLVSTGSVTVFAADGVTPVGFAEVDANGTATFSLPMGDYTFVAIAADDFSTISAISLVAGEAISVDLVIGAFSETVSLTANAVQEVFSNDVPTPADVEAMRAELLAELDRLDAIANGPTFPSVREQANQVSDSFKKQLNFPFTPLNRIPDLPHVPKACNFVCPNVAPLFEQVQELREQAEDYLGASQTFYWAGGAKPVDPETYWARLKAIDAFIDAKSDFDSYNSQSYEQVLLALSAISFAGSVVTMGASTLAGYIFLLASAAGALESARATIFHDPGFEELANSMNASISGMQSALTRLIKHDWAIEKNRVKFNGLVDQIHDKIRELNAAIARGIRDPQAQRVSESIEVGETITENALANVQGDLNGIEFEVIPPSSLPRGFSLSGDGTYSYTPDEPGTVQVDYKLVVDCNDGWFFGLTDTKITSDGSITIIAKDDEDDGDGSIDDVSSQDPNDILGPDGFGTEHWVQAAEPLDYTIRFENDPVLATAPAQIVRVTHQLDTDLDARTFRVGDFGFGSHYIDVPDNRAFFTDRIDATADLGVFVDFAAGIDIASGQAFWEFTSIDPMTGDVPANPLLGFLLPNITSPEGDGFVKFSVRPAANAQTGDVVDAEARIVFDMNEAIDTPAIFNTLDAGLPVSAVNALPARVVAETFEVSWSGADDANGSGLKDYTVLVAIDGEAPVVWLENTLLTAATYVGELGHTYEFYSVARDNAGNVEALPPAPDAVTMTPGVSGNIGDFVWLDTNADGIQDATETGFAGVDVHLYRADGSETGMLVASTTTDTNGHYVFADLETSEQYILEFATPAGFAFSLPDQASDNLTDSDVAIASGRTPSFSIASGDNPQWDVGLVELGAIGGVVWLDVDADASPGVDEPPLENWTVYLDVNDNGVLDENEPSRQTGADGRYVFEGLRPGEYIVAQMLPADWEQTFPGASEATSEYTFTGSQVTLLTPGESADVVTAIEAVDLINLDGLQADSRFAATDGSGSAVVVIDSGIDVDHPFFGPDHDSDGVADRIVYQYDFADGDVDASDMTGHGSHVSSVISSQDEYYRGVAPGADIIHLKVFHDSGVGYFSYVEQALQWVVDHAAIYNVAAVNMSLGDGMNWNAAVGQYGLADELAALAAQDVITVSAAGNSFAYFGSNPGLAYPAADPNSLAVGAVWDADRGGPWLFGSSGTDYSTGPDRIASFSQRHSELSDVFAPGALITAANANGGIDAMRGTSMAAPYVAGAAVLAQQISQEHRGRPLTVGEFRALLADSGAAIIDGDDEDDNVVNTGFSFTRLDVHALANAVLDLELAPAGNEEPHPGDDGGNPIGPLDAPPITSTVQLAPGQFRDDVDFGSRPVNTPPSVTVGGNAALFEGQDLLRSGTFGDPDPNDSWTATVDYGDGSVPSTLTLVDNSFELSHTYADNGTYQVAVEITDARGEIGRGDFFVTVENLDPTANPDSVHDVPEDGPAVTIDVLSNDTDPAGEHDSLSIIDVNTTGTLGTVMYTADDISYDPNGQFESLAAGEIATDTFTYRMSDGDGGTATGVVTVTITGANDTPQITGLNSSAEDLDHRSDDGVVMIDGTLVDVDLSDSHTVTVDWGDGTTLDTFEASASEPSSIGSFARSHTYTHGGSYTITVTIDDGAGGTDTLSSTAVVTGLGVVDGTLYVIGTDGKDDVNIHLHDHHHHSHGGTDGGTDCGTDGGHDEPVIHIKSRFDKRGGSDGGTDGGSDCGRDCGTDGRSNMRVPLADVENIVVHVLAGDDKVKIDKKLMLDAFIYGGDGKDKLEGGGGNDMIFGGAGQDNLDGNGGDDLLDGGDHDDKLDGGRGHDVLWGGAGNDDLKGGTDGCSDGGTDGGTDILIGEQGDDRLDGGRGRDLLIGGLGRDYLKGQQGDDLLIAGYTSFDRDLTALDTIMTEWSSESAYADRLLALMGGDGPNLIVGDTVFDDDVRDKLKGNQGRDWYFADLSDKLKGVKPNEDVEGL